jgi:hypothetical protein
LLSNILLTPFDREMRRKGYQLTRWADDWVITCKSAAEARAAVATACKILAQLGVQLHPDKTRIVHVQHGFEFLGYKIKLGQELRLSPNKIRSGAKAGALYAYPCEKSIRRCMDQVRARTRRRRPLKTQELIVELNPAGARAGRVLQTRPCPQALPPTRRLDSAAHLVAPPPALALHGLEGLARSTAVRGVRTGQPCSVNSFHCVSGS